MEASSTLNNCKKNEKHGMFLFEQKNVINEFTSAYMA